ncbi:Asparagine synthase family protein [Aspergillus niger]|uniref:Asparagine synthase family protein n=1 Tax=Aspergillus niger TaxID=5061 RepID=A0A505IJG2_ASPNG|nr:Asparagine synthase family protein [Aspergillus niger]
MELEFHRGRRVAQNQIPSQAYGLRAPVSNAKPPGPQYSMDARSIPRSMSRGAANLLQLSASATISSSTATAATTSTTPATITTTVPALASIPTTTTAPAGTNNLQHPTPDIGLAGTNNDGWSARVLDELKDLLLLLSHDGQVLYASPSCSEVTGIESHMLEQSDFSRFVHEDDKPILGHELDESTWTSTPDDDRNCSFCDRRIIPTAATEDSL